ncbi:adenylate kinase family protein [Candidatus Woesearchaeota archaeon]|nr:adenylate kinase family protein [Candidatus Woesearchaeota archaeon]
MKVICVTGIPATGKTTIAKKLAEKYHFQNFDVSRAVAKYRLAEGYDKKRKTKVIDTKKLNKFLINHISQLKADKKIRGIIIDSHLSHYLPKKYVNLVVVTKCDIKELNKRLKKRRYSQDKIKENLQAEIFNICCNEAFEGKHKIIVIDTTKGFNINRIKI